MMPSGPGCRRMTCHPLGPPPLLGRLPPALWMALLLMPDRHQRPQQSRALPKLQLVSNVVPALRIPVTVWLQKQCLTSCRHREVW